MPRVTHIKHAQQRYKTVQVFDEDGKPKVTAVMRKNGIPKLTKTGRAVVRRVTTIDKNQPLPNHKCDKCGVEIKVGDPYKYITPKSGPYSGIKRFRCGACPSWRVWEYSSSLNARIAQIQADGWDSFDAIAESAENASDFESVLDNAAEQVRGLAEEKQESASNIKDGFGHTTSQSEELAQIATNLGGWADDLDTILIPEPPEDEKEIEESEEEGTDEFTSRDEWIEEVRSAISEVLEAPPV